MKASRQSQVTLVEVHDGDGAGVSNRIPFEDQTLGTAPSPDCNTCLLKQGELR